VNGSPDGSPIADQAKIHLDCTDDVWTVTIETMYDIYLMAAPQGTATIEITDCSNNKPVGSCTNFDWQPTDLFGDGMFTILHVSDVSVIFS